MKIIIYISLFCICFSCFSDRKVKKLTKQNDAVCTKSKLVLSKYTNPLPIDKLTIKELLKVKGSNYRQEENNIITIDVGTSFFSFYKNNDKEFLIYSIIKDPSFTFHKDMKIGVNVDVLGLKGLVKCDTILLENDEYESSVSLVLDSRQKIKTIIYESFYE